MSLRKWQQENNFFTCGFRLIRRVSGSNSETEFLELNRENEFKLSNVLALVRTEFKN